MASRATRKQALVMGMVEGLFAMLWDQRYRDQENNKTFAACREKVIRTTDEGFALLKSQTCNRLEPRDVHKVRRNLEEIKGKLETFHVMTGVGFLTDLVMTQSAKVNGDKRRIFEQLYFRLQEVARTFDKEKRWDDPEGWELAQFFERLEV